MAAGGLAIKLSRLPNLCARVANNLDALRRTVLAADQAATGGQLFNNSSMDADYRLEIPKGLKTPFVGELGKRTVIYYLVDPRTDEIRYVGKTDQALASRVSAHMRDTAPCHRVHWLNELKAAGWRPFPVPIVALEGECSWQEEERYWIARLLAMGARLVNNTSGGDGVRDLPPEARARRAAVWKGRKHKPETITKLRAARANYVCTDETRAKMSRTRAGRTITWGDQLATALRKLSPEFAAMVKLRLDAGERVKAIAAELNLHRTTVSKIKMGTYFDRYQKPKGEPAI